MASGPAKDEAHKLIDTTPENSTCDDFIHLFYVRQAIERGLDDSKTGRTKDAQEIRKEYGLPV